MDSGNLAAMSSSWGKISVDKIQLIVLGHRPQSVVLVFFFMHPCIHLFSNNNGNSRVVVVVAAARATTVYLMLSKC